LIRCLLTFFEEDWGPGLSKGLNRFLPFVMAPGRGSRCEAFGRGDQGIRDGAFFWRLVESPILEKETFASLSLFSSLL